MAYSATSHAVAQSTAGKDGAVRLG